jgi:hypothetical protein
MSWRGVEVVVPISSLEEASLLRRIASLRRRAVHEIWALTRKAFRACFKQDIHPDRPVQPTDRTGGEPQPPDAIFNYVPAHLTIYAISAETLETLSTGYTSIAQSACITFLGILATLLVTLFTVPLDVLGHAVFAALVLASFGLVLVTGVLAYRDWRSAKTFAERIRSGRQAAGA